MENEIKYKGYKIKIEPDVCAKSPEEWRDDGLFLVGYHCDFWVEGPRVYHKLPEGVKRDKDDKGHLLFTKEEVIELFNNGMKHKYYYVFGLEAYIHSGVCLALSHEGNFPDRQWDVSQLGAVFVSKKEFKRKDKARKAALALLEEWNQYLSGDVWGYVAEDAEGRHIDSCWGFYGDEGRKDAEQQARDSIDYDIEQGNKIAPVAMGA